MPLTGVPRCVSHCLRGLKPWFRPRHQLVFSWLLVLPLVYGERANLKALARHGPVPLTYRHSRRLLRAASWGTTTLLWWFVDQALQAFPPPEEGTRYGLGDRTLNGKRGARHPVAQRTRLSHRHPSGFGVRRVLLGARWGVYRLPVAFAWLRRKDAADYQTEDALFRQMPRDFRPPGGCQEVVVAAAAYACRPHMALIQERGYW